MIMDQTRVMAVEETSSGLIQYIFWTHTPKKQPQKFAAKLDVEQGLGALVKKT